MDCTTVGNPFEKHRIQKMIDVVTGPFGVFLDVKSVSRKERHRMLMLAKEMITYSDDQKTANVFGKLGFIRASSLGKKYGDTPLKSRDIALKAAQRLATGTAFHNVQEDVFNKINEIIHVENLYFDESGNQVMRFPSANDLTDMVRSYLIRTYANTPIQVNQNLDDFTFDLTVTYGTSALNQVADYVQYLLLDIEKNAILNGTTLDQVDIYPEQPTANFMENIAGTQDLLVVFPNNKALVYDHKTSMRSKNTATSGPSAASNFDFHSKQLQQYTTGNVYFGVEVSSAFIMPVLQVPDFDITGTVGNGNNIDINYVFSSADDSMSTYGRTSKPNTKSFQPLAIPTSVGITEELQEPIRALGAMIEKVSRINKVNLRRKPSNMDDTTWNKISQEFNAWQEKYKIRLSRYKELFQSITVHYDFSKVIAMTNEIETAVNELKDIVYGAKGTSELGLLDMIKNQDDNFDAFMDNIYNVQETLRKLATLKNEIEGIHTFFKSDVVNRIMDFAQFTNYGHIADSMGKLFLNYYNHLSGINQPIAKLYYSEDTGTWYGEDDLDSLSVVEGLYEVNIQLPAQTVLPTLNENMFAPPGLFVTKDNGRSLAPSEYIINPELFDDGGKPGVGLLSYMYSLMYSKETGMASYSDTLVTLRKLDNTGRPYNIDMSTISMVQPQGFTHAIPTMLMNLGSMNLAMLMKAYAGSLSADFIKDNSVFDGLHSAIDTMEKDLIIAGIDKSYVKNSKDKGDYIQFRPMTFFESGGLSSELINHPMMQQKSAILSQVGFEKNRQADDQVAHINDVFKRFYEYAKNNGGKDALVNKLVDKKTGTFYQKYAAEFIQKVNEAYVNDEYEYIFDNFEIVDEQAYIAWRDQEIARFSMYIDNPNVISEYEKSISLLGVPTEAWSNPRLKKFLRVKPSVYDTALSQEYKVIQSAPSLLEVYNLFTNMMHMTKEIVGDNFASVPLETPFLPMFQEEMSGMIMNAPETGVGNVVKTAMEMLVSQATINPTDPVIGMSMQGDLARTQIPLPGVMSLVNLGKYGQATEEQTLQNASKMSYELEAVAIMFTYSMLGYEQLKLTEPIAHAMNAVMRSDRYEEVTRNAGGIERDAGGKLNTVAGRTKEGESRRFTKMFEKWMYYDWYGIRYLDTKREWIDTVFVPEDRKKGRGAITLRSTIMAMKAMYSRNVLGLAAIPSAAALMAGIINGYINSTEHLSYDEAGFRRALKKMMSSPGRASMRAMGVHLDVYTIPVAEYLSHKAKSAKSKMASDYVLYGPLRLADMWITDVVTNAVLNYYGLDVEGNLVELNKVPGAEPIINAFHFTDQSGALVVDPVINRKVSDQLKHIITRATRDTFGQIPENQKMGWQFDFAGTLMLTFSTWVPAMVYKRIGTATYDRYLDKILIGRYKGVAQAFGTPEAARANIGSLLTNIKEYSRFVLGLVPFTGTPSMNEDRIFRMFIKWKNANPEEAAAASRGVTGMKETEKVQYQKYKEAINRAVVSSLIEIRFSVLMYLSVHAMRMDYDDDGEPLYKEFWPARQLYKVLAKTHTELIFLMDPRQATMLLTHPIPAFGILKDAVSIITNTGDEALDWLTGRDDARDQSPVFYYSRRFVPGMIQLSRVMEFYKQDKENPYAK